MLIYLTFHFFCEMGYLPERRFLHAFNLLCVLTFEMQAGVVQYMDTLLDPMSPPT